MNCVTRKVSTSLAFLALAIAGGCSSDSKPVSAPPPQASSSSGSSSMNAAATNQPGGLAAYRAGLVQGEQQMDATLTSLKALTDPAQMDLRGAYDKYCDNLARMNQHAETMKAEADQMRASRDTYFSNWEEKASEIDNPTIRASAEARRKRLRDAHESIITTSGEARDAYQPFMKDLQDIRKYLASDLSKASVADLSDAVKKVNADGVVVKQKVDAVIKTLDTIQGT